MKNNPKIRDEMSINNGSRVCEDKRTILLSVNPRKKRKILKEKVSI